MIIGVTGTLGAGKGTIVEILKKKGFRHYSARQLLVEEIEKRGLLITRDNMVLIANEFRKTKSPTYIAETLYEKAMNYKENAVIESLRTPLEVEALRKKGDFYLIAIDADPKVRYERIVKRGSSTDNVSYEKFLEDEQKELNSKEAYKGNISACMKMADFSITNNGSFFELENEVNKIYQHIRTKA